MAVIIRTTADVLVALGVPMYSSERSNHVFSEHFKIGLLVLRQYLDLSYERLCELLGSAKGVMKAGCIRRIPDPSTLRKFAKRINADVLNSVIGSLAAMVCGTEMTVALDATGFSVSRASMHYLNRLREFGNDVLDDVRSSKAFMKATFAVDTDSLAILACSVSRGNVHDVKHVPDVLDTIRNAGFMVRCVVADKGYDAEKVHEQIHERLGADTAIPVRNTGQKAFLGKRKKLPRGKNRKRMAVSFPSDVYRRRSMAETVNSMIKRISGGSVRSLLDATRAVEVLCKCAAHNFRRLFGLGVI